MLGNTAVIKLSRLCLPWKLLTFSGKLILALSSALCARSVADTVPSLLLSMERTVVCCRNTVGAMRTKMACAQPGHLCAGCAAWDREELLKAHQSTEGERPAYARYYTHLCGLLSVNSGEIRVAGPGIERTSIGRA
jgi:hypothetical protein